MNRSVCNTAQNKTLVSELRRGLRASFPMMLGFIPFALLLGSQAVQKGFSILEVPLMTGLNFGGGSEFAAVELWTSPPHALLIVSVALLVNSRHLIMGMVFSQIMNGIPRGKALIMLFFMCDESWAMGLADARQSRGRLNTAYFMGTSLGLYACWVIFTGIGAFIAPLIGDVSRFGFDMAFPAVFLVMLCGMWTGYSATWTWLASLSAAGATHHLLPGAWYVPAGIASGLLAACFCARKL